VNAYLFIFLFNRGTTGNSSKSSNPTLDQQSSLSSIEEKSLASRCSISSNDNKSPIKQRQSTDILSTNIKTITIKKPTITKPK
jgi:hypothetical protein